LAEQSQKLDFSRDLTIDAERVTLPSNLQSLTFGSLVHGLDRMVLPSSLQILSLGWMVDDTYKA
jgi:hypothetical protein